MNGKLYYCLVAMFLLQIVNPAYLYSQKLEKFNFGVSAGLTAERFGVTRNFKYPDQTRSTQSYKANSLANFSGMLWAERILSPTWSLIPEIGVEFVHVKDNILSGALSKSGYGVDITETHHYVTGALYLRKYIYLNSKVKLFGDLGFKADKLVRFKNEYGLYKHNVGKPGSNNVNPALLLGAGAKRGRWAFSAEYHYYLGTPLDKRYRNTLDINGMETILDRQSLAVKAAYAVIR